jgi:predicted MFS family arabinose efflux permease
MSNRNYYPYLMWGFPMIFFAFQFILRIWPSQVMQPIMQQFQIDASSFGMLASSYYWGYAGAQIPIAILLNKFGAKKVVFLCALVCGIATVVFANTNIWWLAMLSRFVVGATSAAGFLGVSQTICEWFDSSDYARMVGLSFSFGLLGAVYGGKPVALLIEQFEGISVAYALGGFSILLAFLIIIFFKDRRTNNTQNKSSFSDLRVLFNYPTVWVLGIANLLMVGTLEGFADVWGVNFLTTAIQVTKSDAAGLISFIFVGMLFGGPILAKFAKHIGEYNVIIYSGLCMAAVFAALLLTKAGDYKLIAVLFLISGIFCCYQVLIFAVGKNMVIANHQNVVIALLNALNMLGGSFFHSSIGISMGNPPIIRSK